MTGDKYETVEVSFSECRVEYFKEPSRFFYVNAVGNRVYILKCQDRLKAQKFVDWLYTPGFFTIRTNMTRDDAALNKQRLVKQNKPEHFKPVRAVSTKRGQKKF